MTWEIIEGDCVDHLSRFEGMADLVLTSPPYGSIRDYGGHAFDWERVIDAIVPVLTEGGVCVWIVNDETVNGDESGDSFRQALRFKERGLLLHDTMIYLKAGGSGGKTWRGRHSSEFEFMLVFSKGRPKTFNPIIDVPVLYRRTAFSSPRNKDGALSTRKPRLRPAKAPRSNVWRYTLGAMDPDYPHGLNDHPAMFPLALAKDHIRTWTNEGDLVIDPMCGSGTTLRAAEDLGRRSVGIEINPPYCAIVRERMRQQVLL